MEERQGRLLMKLSFALLTTAAAAAVATLKYTATVVAS